jgi:beta-glucanase (GH16 family)
VPGVDGQTYTSKSFLYGDFEVKARTDIGSGAGSAIWLSAADGSWPPEIDIAEIPDGTRTWAATNVHFGANNLQYSAFATGKFSVNNTWDLIWTPTSLQVLLNGKPLEWSFNGRSLNTTVLTDPAAIPHIPMRVELTMQKGWGADWYSGVHSPPYHWSKKESLHVSSVRVYQSPTYAAQPVPEH